ANAAVPDRAGPGGTGRDAARAIHRGDAPGVRRAADRGRTAPPDRGDAGGHAPGRRGAGAADAPAPRPDRAVPRPAAPDDRASPEAAPRARRVPVPPVGSGGRQRGYHLSAPGRAALSVGQAASLSEEKTATATP